MLTSLHLVMHSLTNLVLYLRIYLFLNLRIYNHVEESPVYTFRCCVGSSQIQGGHQSHQVLICEERQEAEIILLFWADESRILKK